jgi:hypothetical protein
MDFLVLLISSPEPGMSALGPLIGTVAKDQMDLIKSKVLGHRTGVEVKLLEYLEKLNLIITEYRNIYVKKRKSATFGRIMTVEVKMACLMDFYKQDMFAGSYLLAAMIHTQLSVDDIKYTIVHPRNSTIKTLKETREDANTAYNLLQWIITNAGFVQESSTKLDNAFKALSSKWKHSTADFKLYISKLLEDVKLVRNEATVEEENDEGEVQPTKE